MLIKSQVEYETEVTNEDVAKIAQRLVTKYEGQSLLRAGADKKESWIVVWTTDENEFQDFLHAEFLKLIPVLEVSKDNMVNTLSWPTEDTPQVLHTIEAMESVPTV